MVANLTINDISRKLIKNNYKQYGLFFASIFFSIMMVGAYGVLQFSPTITNVLADGGSTQVISVGMFFFSMLGIIIFLLYADSLFLKYKSNEIGIFLSLGIKRQAIQKIVQKEFTILFQIAVLLGLLFSIPFAFLCWSILNIFLSTAETTFQIGWAGLVIAIFFGLLTWLVLNWANSRYILRVDIMKILKTSEEVEEIHGKHFIWGFIGLAAIPTGIVLFFLLQSMDGICNILSYLCLGASIYGLYVFIIQLASIGDILKRIYPAHYYKNIIFLNLIKQNIRQYTRSIFVATILITITIFGLGFISSGFTDGYYTALNEPYDYVVNTSFEQNPITGAKIKKWAEQYNIEIKELKTLQALLIAKENVYHDSYTDWSSRLAVSESEFNKFVIHPATVEKGSYTFYYDQSMSYKLNAFQSSVGKFYNPTTKQEFTLKQNEPIAGDRLFNSRWSFSSFVILNDQDYEQLAQSMEPAYDVVTYMFNVTDWKTSHKLQEKLLDEIVMASNGQVYSNWHNSAHFDKVDESADYYPYKGNEIRSARIWIFYPLSKISSTTTQVEAFATYLMLMFFIAMITFISSIMVIGLKIIGTIWNDKKLYEDLMRLGMKRKEIKSLVTKQIVFIYFIPTIIGCLLGAFATHRIILAADVIYIQQVMNIVIGLTILISILQIIIFYFLRRKVLEKI